MRGESLGDLLGFDRLPVVGGDGGCALLGGTAGRWDNARSGAYVGAGNGRGRDCLYGKRVNKKKG